MEQEDFDRTFLYRLKNIMVNAVIVEAKLLSPLKGYWSDFSSLCERCKVPVPSKDEIDADKRA